jgi:hypothetical protein
MPNTIPPTPNKAPMSHHPLQIAVKLSSLRPDALVGAWAGAETTLFGSSVEMHEERTEMQMSMPIVRLIH